MEYFNIISLPIQPIALLLIKTLSLLLLPPCPTTTPVSACEMDQTHYGCRIDNGLCTCAYGCRSEFRYKTKRECQDALKGRGNNVCVTSPCQHGSCTQISQMPGYKCRCEGTGFYGNRCQIRCPTEAYPVECIVIWGAAVDGEEYSNNKESTIDELGIRSRIF